MGSVWLGFILSIITEGEGQQDLRSLFVCLTSVFVLVTHTMYGTGLMLMA